MAESVALPISVAEGVPVQLKDKVSWKVRCPSCNLVKSPTKRLCPHCVKDQVDELHEQIRRIEKEYARVFLFNKNLRSQNEYLRGTLEIVRDELYKYWIKEEVAKGVSNPLDTLPKRFVELIRDSDRIEL